MNFPKGLNLWNFDIRCPVWWVMIEFFSCGSSKLNKMIEMKWGKMTPKTNKTSWYSSTNFMTFLCLKLFSKLTFYRKNETFLDFMRSVLIFNPNFQLPTKLFKVLIVLFLWFSYEIFLIFQMTVIKDPKDMVPLHCYVNCWFECIRSQEFRYLKYSKRIKNWCFGSFATF